jgi:hypothetical protein
VRNEKCIQNFSQKMCTLKADLVAEGLNTGDLNSVSHQVKSGMTCMVTKKLSQCFRVDSLFLYLYQIADSKTA